MGLDIKGMNSYSVPLTLNFNELYRMDKQYG